MTQRAPEDVQATACATWVDQWVAMGLRTVVVAPGSRSTPMALAVAARSDVDVQVAHDERSAAFMALGASLAAGVPAAVLCTSGTAATHFHAAVVEAHLSGVPMLVLTADRPPELHGIGSPQTIDQQRLYGAAAHFVDLGVPDWDDVDRWRSMAAAVFPTDGPVHVDLPFREPLVGTPFELPPRASSATLGRFSDGNRPSIARDDVREWLALLDQVRGVIIAGRGVDDPAAVESFARAVAWPVLADPRSNCRGLSGAVVAFDSLLRDDEFADAHTPSVVLHLGEPPASKVLGQWLQRAGATHLQVLPRDVVIDPLRLIDRRVVGPVGEVLTALSDGVRGATDTPWLARWLHAEAGAQAAIEATLDGGLSEPLVSRLLSGRRGALVVASSMPIRDIEWFGHPQQQCEVVSNRGANGIDGVIATGIGVALGRSDRTATVLLGDIAFVHDSSSLAALARRDVTVRIVVTDNDGGGIFSFLPQASLLGADRFEQLFGTPHGTDIVGLAAAHGLWAVDVHDEAGLLAALDRPGSGVVRVATDRAGNVAVHRRINDAVVRSLR